MNENIFKTFNCHENVFVFYGYFFSAAIIYVLMRSYQRLYFVNIQQTFGTLLLNNKHNIFKVIKINWNLLCNLPLIAFLIDKKVNTVIIKP